MAGNGGLYCLGCGENLVGKKPYERRVLYTLQGKKVKDSWKELLTSAGTVSVVAEIDLDKPSIYVSLESLLIYPAVSPRERQ